MTEILHLYTTRLHRFTQISKESLIKESYMFIKAAFHYVIEALNRIEE